MMPIIYDGYTVVRAQASIEVLEEFLKADDADFAEQRALLAKPQGVVICYKNRVRLKRLPGSWVQISGYREDGGDLALAVLSLRNAERRVENRHRTKMARPAAIA